MSRTSQNLYRTPFSLAYWREAGASFRDLRGMMFAALMVAACIILSEFSIPIMDGPKITFGYLARALCSLVYGPIGAVVFAVAEDTLSFLMSNKGYVYFPGYMITTITGCIIYALFFYRARITLWRIIIAKLITNIQNVLLGSLWSAMLYSKGYIYYMSTSGVKNLLYYPVQVLLLVLLLQEVLPVMHRLHWSPCQLEGERIPWL